VPNCSGGTIASTITGIASAKVTTAASGLDGSTVV
jgi:hypothetical protein